MINNHNSYYCVDNQRFYNKNQALLASNGDATRVKLHFMEHIWDNADWTQEPPHTWQQLCAERALELRDRYKHLALWYSGGYDSYTILQTFIKNNILLDEIVVMDRNDIFLDSGLTYALKTVEKVKKQYYPNIHINIIQSNVDELGNFYKKYDTDWIYEMVGSTTRLSKTNKLYYTEVFDHALKTFKNENTRCNILGHEKCKVYLHDSVWYGFFTDSNLADFIGENIENFYYSPQLYLKQVHNIIRWFESLPHFSADLVHDIQGRDRKVGGVYTRYYAEWNLAMGRYPLDLVDTASIHGYQKLFFTEDENSIDSKKILDYYEKNDKQVYNIYMSGLNKLKKTFGQTIGINPTILTKPYTIRKAARAY